MTCRTIERRSLGLYDAHDAGLPAGQAGLSVPLINAVIDLKVAWHVAGDAIGAVAKRRALVLDRVVQNADHFGMDALPLCLSHAVTRSGRMNAGTVQDFRGIEIPHAGQGLLVQQRDLDRTAA